MGNICRSPTAEGVFAALIKKKNIADQFDLDSAGTHAYHIDEAPDLRSQRAAKDRGVDLSYIRARKVVFGDFEDFDYLLAMDSDNHQILMSACPEQYKQKVNYFLHYAPHLNTLEVPDPYYGGEYGFERVLDMIEDASIGFLNEVQPSGEQK